MRRFLAVVVALSAVVVSTVGVTAVWGRNQVLVTDRYLESVTPLASDPVIQGEIADKVTDALTRRIETAAPGLDGVRPVVSLAAHGFVESDEFASAWEVLNRQGHRQLVTVLTDRDGRVQLDLSSVVEAVRTLVAEAGLRVVTAIPPITLVVDLADVQGIDRARSAVNLLDDVANLVPLVAVLLLGLAVVAARRRLRAAAWLGGVLAGVSLLMVGVVLLGSSVAASQVPASVASDDAVHAYYGHLTALLRNGYLSLAALAGGAALVCAVLARREPSLPATPDGVTFRR